jgi:hypothetical protein
VTSRLDAFLPEWHFHEVHERTMAATPARVMQAIRGVTPGEVRFFRLLLALRGFGRTLDPDGTAAQRPILAGALKRGFLMLAEEPDRELVLGTVGQFWRIAGTRAAVAGPPEFLAFDRPGHAKAGINFLLQATADGRTSVSTETRILALDASAKRRFGAYWTVIRPGSALIRRSWLAAIEARAVAPGG